MTERAVILSGPEVCAVRAGRKTQLRRLVTLTQFQRTDTNETTTQRRSSQRPSYQNMKVGDLLWVQEDFTHVTGNGVRIHYRADGEPIGSDGKVLPTEAGLRRWRSSATMPRDHSRVTLQITEMRVQRLQDISAEDARAEGCRAYDAAVVFQAGPVGDPPHLATEMSNTARGAFACLWDSINAKRAPWASNPRVWAISFSAQGIS